MGPAGRQLVHGSPAAVMDPHLVARLQQILCHGLAHDAQTDKSNFHNNFSFI